MARVKRAVNALKKRRKVMRLAKGYFGAKSKQYRAASEQVRRSLRYAYIGRKQKKRDFRRLWIARIYAAHDQRPEGRRRGHQPQGALRAGHLRPRRFHRPGGEGQGSREVRLFHCEAPSIEGAFSIEKRQPLFVERLALAFVRRRA